MILRNFLYLNEQMLDDYLSSIEGYLATTVIKTEKQSNTKNAGVGVSTKLLSGKLGKEKSDEIETKMEVQITPASKVQRFLDYLESEEPIKFYDYVDDGVWQDVQREEILEFMGTVRFSKLKEITHAVIELEKLCDALQEVSPTQILDKKTLQTIQGLKKLNDVQNGNEIPCVLSFNGSKEFQVVCYLDKAHFIVNQENFVGDVTILCKVQKKVSKGNSIELTDFQNF